ncbi:MAG: metalloregulator ArsR/SmtB family transcription factor [Lysobacterales bacterium]
MKPETLFGLLSDPTRLRTLLLILAESEVCVCELTYTLEESQPKISRHLALMREAGIVESRREGTWMHYRINPSLPIWVKEVIETLFEQLCGVSPYPDDRKKLAKMKDRPERSCA